MKIQYIAVIFIIIIVPISLTVSSYINSQIDTITLQTLYDTKLNDSTYDMVRAFQINTVNNKYSTISDSKIRDIEAAVNAFYNSLSINEQKTKEEMRDYVPAILFTLYDGYYIYSKYDNVYPENKGQPILSQEALKERDAEFVLKPYIYYSCRYKNASKDFVVNYTLDNFITIYGDLGDGYETISGYLINPNSVTLNNPNFVTDLSKITKPEEIKQWNLKYSEVIIKPEILTEHLLFSTKTDGKNYDSRRLYIFNIWWTKDLL